MSGAADPATPARKSEFLITASLFLVSTAILYLAIINDDWQDPYIHFRAGERIARGDVPYKDVFLFWFPGAPLALAAWFKLFGTSLAGLQILQALCAGAGVTLGWLIARLTIPSPIRIAVPFVLGGAYVVGNQGLNHMSFSAPLALLAIYAALQARPTGSWTWCLTAGAAAGLAGMFTITTGAWLGVALVASAACFAERRLRSGLLIAAGGASVLALLLVYLLATGVLQEFVASAIVWPRERYAPFHAGVGWGAWLPSWEMLDAIPEAWKATWFLTLCLVWGQTYVLPAIVIVSIALFPMRKQRQPERLILLLAATALILSAFPNAAPMRLVRLSGPLWLLILYELSTFADGSRRGQFVAASAFILVFAAILPLQWSYRHQLTALQTPRGTARVQPLAVMEYQTLEKAMPPESRVAIMPEYRPAAWLLKYDNPTRFDTLTPVLYSPAQLQQACDDLAAAGYPPVVYFTASELATIDSVKRSFGPSKYVEEWDQNPLRDLLSQRYNVALQDPPMVILKAKPVSAR